MSTALTRASTILPIGLLFTLTKGAVESLVRVLAHDPALAARRITVNAVAPGPVDTPLFRAGKSAELIRWIASLSPAGRLAGPEEVSPVVAWLCAREAGWVNGQVIGVSGVGRFVFLLS